MDIQSEGARNLDPDIAFRILTVLSILTRPIRVPTACWLMTDQFNILDSTVRRALDSLQKQGKVRIDNGGWVHVLRY